MIEVRALERDAPPEDLLAVEGLFTAMYGHMDGLGLMVPLAPGGAGLWLKALMPMLGKLHTIHVAWAQDPAAPGRVGALRAVGFAAGSIRVGPAHLGGLRSGAVTHLYVDPSERGGGVGRRLYEALSGWFTERGLLHQELEVLVQNEPARRFWTSLGFVPDHLVMRRLPARS